MYIFVYAFVFNTLNYNDIVKIILFDNNDKSIMNEYLMAKRYAHK
jgi:hypothetical protein